MPQNLTYDKSRLAQVMVWCRQATSHCLSLCWPRFISPCAVTRPQWVNRSYLNTVIDNQSGDHEVPCFIQFPKNCYMILHKIIRYIYNNEVPNEIFVSPQEREIYLKKRVNFTNNLRIIYYRWVLWLPQVLLCTNWGLECSKPTHIMDDLLHNSTSN